MKIESLANDEVSSPANTTQKFNTVFSKDGAAYCVFSHCVFPEKDSETIFSPCGYMMSDGGYAENVPQTLTFLS